jgi:hypothetical protein
MQIAFERVAENDRAGIAVLVEQALQIQGHRRQLGHGNRDILDDDGGAGRPRRTDRREQALTNRPQLGEFFGPVGELVRDAELAGGDGGGDDFDLRVRLADPAPGFPPAARRRFPADP